MINNTTSLQELFDLAKEKAETITITNEVFIVKDLFRGIEWNRIPKGLRTKLGSLFFSYVNNEGSQIIEPLGKTPQNQQIYKRK